MSKGYTLFQHMIHAIHRKTGLRRCQYMATEAARMTAASRLITQEGLCGQQPLATDFSDGHTMHMTLLQSGLSGGC